MEAAVVGVPYGFERWDGGVQRHVAGVDHGMQQLAATHKPRFAFKARVDTLVAPLPAS